MTDVTTQISPVTQDYLKAIWQATEWGGAPATTSWLAARFGTTAANVSDLLSRLAKAGLVTREPYRPCVLTAHGEELALSMVRRHRLIETYLVEALGYACTEVHHDAELLEHAASTTFIDRLDAHLGHPRFDPHGDPIPDAAGNVTYPQDAVPAADAAPGRYVVARISDADPQVIRALHELGIHRGTAVVIEQADQRAISRASGGGSLGAWVLAAIWVCDAGDTSSRSAAGADDRL